MDNRNDDGTARPGVLYADELVERPSARCKDTQASTHKAVGKMCPVERKERIPCFLPTMDPIYRNGNWVRDVPLQSRKHRKSVTLGRFEHCGSSRHPTYLRIMVSGHNGFGVSVPNDNRPTGRFRVIPSCLLKEIIKNGLIVECHTGGFYAYSTGRFYRATSQDAKKGLRKLTKKGH